uniref:STEAP family member 4 n=1 Tax=Salarias fasciatus TaxID=181472 RepID=A0A672HXY9_SALFA
AEEISMTTTFGTAASSIKEKMKPDGVMLHSLNTAAVPEPELMCIFGTGDLGRSLGQRLLQSGYRVVYGSRRPNTCASDPQVLDVFSMQAMTHAAAAQSASLIFVCVHREHYGFMEIMLVPHAAVVKGFNTLSSWALQNGLLAGKQVYLCGDNAEAKCAVAETATRLGLTVLDKGSLSAAGELEDFPLRLFSEWKIPLCVAVGLTAFFYFYLLIRDVIYAYVEKSSDISYRIMMSLGNEVFPIVSLIMLALCYLPGIIAAFFQLYRGTKYSRFPNWLDRWMLCRKQMGLVALGFAFLHAVYTFVKPLRYNVRYNQIAKAAAQVKQNNEITPFDNTEAWSDDSLLVLGILGFFLFVLLGLTSLPSVGGSLSWREFSFVQSKLGYLTLFICTAHVYIRGWNKFLKISTYKWYTPPGYMLCLIVPSVVLVLKLLLLLPCMDRTLTRIRQGWERTKAKEVMGVTNL